MLGCSYIIFISGWFLGRLLYIGKSLGKSVIKVRHFRGQSIIIYICHRLDPIFTISICYQRLLKNLHSVICLLRYPLEGRACLLALNSRLLYYQLWLINGYGDQTHSLTIGIYNRANMRGRWSVYKRLWT